MDHKPVEQFAFQNETTTRVEKDAENKSYCLMSQRKSVLRTASPVFHFLQLCHSKNKDSSISLPQVWPKAYLSPSYVSPEFYQFYTPSLTLLVGATEQGHIHYPLSKAQQAIAPWCRHYTSRDNKQRGTCQAIQELGLWSSLSLFFSLQF